MKVLGLMSGTSLDGLDICLADFTEEKQLHFQIVAAQTYPYTATWREKLNFKNLSAWELQKLDHDFAHLQAQLVKQFCAEHNIERESIRLLAAHGHTWFHRPDQGISLQIGNGPSLAAETGIPLYGDFRSQDLALGGQGAPLVPIGDRDLFPDYDACLNLGGFANISFDDQQSRRAFDIGPCNLPLNHYCKALGLNYDEDGHIAASFAHDEQLFAELNKLSYYQEEAPKSLGREWLEEIFIPSIEKHPLSPEIKIATINRHIAYQISQSLKAHGLKTVLLSGGGALNQTLVDSIGIWGSFKLVKAPPEIIHFKEALIFAYLGYLREQGKINVLASVTGARKDHSSGRYYNP